MAARDLLQEPGLHMVRGITLQEDPMPTIADDETQEIATPKRLRKLPWEGVEKGKYPWTFRHWLVNPDPGGFSLCNDQFEIRTDENTGQKLVIHKGFTDQNPRQFPIATYGDVQESFKYSATRGVSLLEGYLLHKGEREVSPSFVEKVKTGAKRYADTKYADDQYAAPKPQAVKKRGPGRPKKNPEPSED